MKYYKLFFAALFLFIFSSTLSFSQTRLLRKRIYFYTDSFVLNCANKATLDQLMDTLKWYENYNIRIRGNTDNVGEQGYNLELSQKRAQSTKKYLMEKGVPEYAFSLNGFGELKPVASNETDIGKQVNRRVEIDVSLGNKKIFRDTSDTSSIVDLLRLLSEEPQTFSINPEKDTSLLCKNGTILYMKANTFDVKGRVSISVRESYQKSNMVLDNLSTNSNGKILESDGMIYIEAKDKKGKKLMLPRNKSITTFMPTSRANTAMKIFQGSRSGNHESINWLLNNTSNISLLGLNDFNDCAQYKYNDGKNAECHLFFCKIKRFFTSWPQRDYYNAYTNTRVKSTVLLYPRVNKCSYMDMLYRQYHVRNIDDLEYAMNKKQFDKYNVCTMAELADTLKKEKMGSLESAYASNTITYADMQYYVYNTTKLGWANCDMFTGYPKENLVTVNVKLKPANNVDCKIIFRNRKVLLGANPGRNSFTIGGIPSGEPIWISVLKYSNGKAWLSITEANASAEENVPDFKEYSLAELKEKLKLLDE